MLSEHEQQAIEHERHAYPTVKALGIEALKIVQRHRGWLSDESLSDISDYLGMAITELESTATFYNHIFRRSVGTHIVRVCDSISCSILGYSLLLKELQRILQIEPGQTTHDGSFTLLPMVCMGACDHAPVLMVDEELHHNVTPEQLENILGQYQ